MNIISSFSLQLQNISLDRPFYLALNNSDFWTHQTSAGHHVPSIVCSLVNDHGSSAQFIVRFWAGSSCLSTAKLCLGEGEHVPFMSFTLQSTLHLIYFRNILYGNLWWQQHDGDNKSPENTVRIFRGDILYKMTEQILFATFLFHNFSKFLNL